MGKLWLFWSLLTPTGIDGTASAAAAEAAGAKSAPASFALACTACQAPAQGQGISTACAKNIEDPRERHAVEKGYFQLGRSSTTNGDCRRCIAAQFESGTCLRRNLRHAAELYRDDVALALPENSSGTRKSLARVLENANAEPSLAGDLHILDSLETESMERILKGHPRWWDKLLLDYFGDIYDPSLAKWVVYIDPKGRTHQAIFGNGRRQPVPGFNGAREMWVLVFQSTPVAQADTADPAREAGCASPKDDLYNKPVATMTVFLERIERVMSPGEVIFDAVAKTYAKLANKDLSAAAEARGKLDKGDVGIVTSSSAYLYQIDCSSHGRLYQGSARLTLLPNTRNRVSLLPEDDRRVFKGTDLRMVQRTFINGESGRIGFDLVLGATVNHVDDSRTTKEDLRPNFFLAADWSLGVRSAFPGPFPWRLPEGHGSACLPGRTPRTGWASSFSGYPTGTSCTNWASGPG